MANTFETYDLEEINVEVTMLIEIASTFEGRKDRLEVKEESGMLDMFLTERESDFSS